MNTTMPLKISEYDKIKIVMQEILHTTIAIQKMNPAPKKGAQRIIYAHLNETSLRFEKNRLHRGNDFMRYLQTLKQHLKIALNQGGSEKQPIYN